MKWYNRFMDDTCATFYYVHIIDIYIWNTRVQYKIHEYVAYISGDALLYTNKMGENCPG